MSAIFDKDPEEIPSGVTANPDYDTMAPLLHAIKDAQDAIQEGYVTAIATHLYAMEVSKPEPVNMPKPDYEQIAKDCVARARETAPYLLQELNSVPT